MEDDIKNHVAKLFGGNASTALAQIESFEFRNKELSPRITRCVVHLSEGDISKLKSSIKYAEEDWRDVIIWAEKFEFEFSHPFK